MQKRELKIGLTLLAAILSLYFIVIWVKGVHFFSQKTNTYYIRFANVSGLLKGDVVTIFGYQSGRVANIEPQREDVKVTIELDENIVLQKDALAQIQMKELMGGKIVDIQPGKSPEILPKGAYIASQATMDMLQMSAKMGNMMNELHAEEMRKIFENMEKITSTVAATSEKVPAEKWGEMMGQMQTLMKNATVLTQSAQELTLTAKDFADRKWEKELDMLLIQKDTSFQQIYQLTRQTNSLIHQTDAALRQISEIAKSASQSTAAADTVLRNGERILGQIEKLLVITQSMLNQIDRVMQTTDNKGTLVQKAIDDKAFAQRVDSLLRMVNTTFQLVNEGKLKVSVSLNRKIIAPEEEIEPK